MVVAMKTIIFCIHNLLILTVSSEVYFPVFVGYSGINQSVYDAWVRPWIGHDIPSLTHGLKRKMHVRSHFIDVWKDVQEVRMELFNKNKRVVWINFDGKGSNKINWFSKERLISSSFNDLFPCSTFNYFSLFGDTRQPSIDRKFLINRSYGGCPGDFGWLCITDMHQACPWETRGVPPSFIYTTNNTPRNYTSDSLTADTMVISVLLKV